MCCTYEKDSPHGVVEETHTSSCQHEPAERLHHEVVPGAHPPAGRTEARDAADDEPRIQLAQRGVVEPGALEHARPEVVDDDVGVRDESRSRSTTRSESSVESSSIDIARLNCIESSRR